MSCCKTKDPTKTLVIWIFNAMNVILIASMFFVYEFLKKENTFEIAMAELFVFGALFSLIGSIIGGYLGAVMEEDVCGKMDMGVLSTMGAFLGCTVCSLIGCALVGLYFFFPVHWIHIPLCILVLSLAGLSFFPRIKIVRTVPIDCCGKRVDSDGEPLLVQPMKMKNKLGIMLALTAFFEVLLTLIMVVVMKRDLANQWMLGGMMYGMGGAMLGGMLGGWLSGLLDKHEGASDCDNPIMVCGMSLMGGMMAGMLAGMIGGMNALMGAGTIVPTVILPLVILGVFYFWMFRKEFAVKWKKQETEKIGELVWQES